MWSDQLVPFNITKTSVYYNYQVSIFFCWETLDPVEYVMCLFCKIFSALSDVLLLYSLQCDLINLRKCSRGLKKKKRRRLLILSARGEKKSNSCSVRANYLEEVNHFNCFLKRLWRAASGLVPGILVLRDLKSEWLRRERYRLNFALGYLREADASFTLCAERASESFAPEVRWRAAVLPCLRRSTSPLQSAGTVPVMSQGQNVYFSIHTADFHQARLPFPSGCLCAY